jgi:hypothetical protein
MSLFYMPFLYANPNSCRVNIWLVTLSSLMLHVYFHIDSSSHDFITTPSSFYPQYVAYLLSPPMTLTNSLATTRLVCSLGCSGSYHS